MTFAASLVVLGRVARVLRARRRRTCSSTWPPRPSCGRAPSRRLLDDDPCCRTRSRRGSAAARRTVILGRGPGPRGGRDGRAHAEGSHRHAGRVAPDGAVPARTARARGPGPRRDRYRDGTRDARRSTSRSPASSSAPGRPSVVATEPRPASPAIERDRDRPARPHCSRPAVSIVPMQLLAWRLASLPRPRPGLLPRGREGDDA